MTSRVTAQFFDEHDGAIVSILLLNDYDMNIHWQGKKLPKESDYKLCFSGT